MIRLNAAPNLTTRIILIISISIFAYIENNPFVRLEAKLGLSPSPLERYLGVKSLFSGMTEGVHQLFHLNIYESVQANIFSPLVVFVLIYFISTWKFPKLDTIRKEYAFFLSFIVLSILVNIYN